MAIDLLTNIICPAQLFINPQEEFMIIGTVINLGDMPAEDFTFQFEIPLFLGTTVALTQVSGDPATSVPIGQDVNAATLKVTYDNQFLPATIGSASSLLEFSITLKNVYTIRGPIAIYPQVSALAEGDANNDNNTATCMIYLT